MPEIPASLGPIQQPELPPVTAETAKGALRGKNLQLARTIENTEQPQQAQSTTASHKPLPIAAAPEQVKVTSENVRSVAKALLTYVKETNSETIGRLRQITKDYKIVKQELEAQLALPAPLTPQGKAHLAELKIKVQALKHEFVKELLNVNQEKLNSMKNAPQVGKTYAAVIAHYEKLSAKYLAGMRTEMAALRGFRQLEAQESAPPPQPLQSRPKPTRPPPLTPPELAAAQKALAASTEAAAAPAVDQAKFGEALGKATLVLKELSGSENSYNEKFLAPAEKFISFLDQRVRRSAHTLFKGIDDKETKAQLKDIFSKLTGENFKLMKAMSDSIKIKLVEAANTLEKATTPDQKLEATKAYADVLNTIHFDEATQHAFAEIMQAFNDYSALLAQNPQIGTNVATLIQTFNYKTNSSMPKTIFDTFMPVVQRFPRYVLLGDEINKQLGPFVGSTAIGKAATGFTQRAREVATRGDTHVEALSAKAAIDKASTKEFKLGLDFNKKATAIPIASASDPEKEKAAIQNAVTSLVNAYKTSEERLQNLPADDVVGRDRAIKEQEDLRASAQKLMLLEGAANTIKNFENQTLAQDFKRVLAPPFKEPEQILEAGKTLNFNTVPSNRRRSI